MRIAILEDDPAVVAHLQATLKSSLVQDGQDNDCIAFDSGEKMRRALRQESFDMLVLDWNVPDLDGFDLLRWLREEKQDETQVLMLSARTSEKDIVGALRRGAGDYVIKPFRPLELRARIARLYARGRHAANKERFTFLNWHFDPEKCEVFCANEDGKPGWGGMGIALPPSEFKLALTMFRNIGRTLSRNYLAEMVGYAGAESASRTLDSHIYRLRKKLTLNGERGMSLLVVYGRGYRLEAHEVPRQVMDVAPPKVGGLHSRSDSGLT